jgi:hypothetical protein
METNVGDLLQTAFAARYQKAKFKAMDKFLQCHVLAGPDVAGIKVAH